MDIFDDCIKGIAEWVLLNEAERSVRRYFAPGRADTGSGPHSRIKKAARTQIILKEETRLELGHPSAGSCSAKLATHDPSLVEDGRVTLIGPDVNETSESVLPFAQIVVACCDGNIEETCSMMDKVLYSSTQYDGYMLRSVPDRIWARVSKEAARSGFSMAGLGFRLIDALRSECSQITAAETIFATSSREDVAALDRIVSPARDRLKKIHTFERRDDGTYECESSLDCSECPEKSVCDTVREVITIRKGDRIITFGGGGDAA